MLILFHLAIIDLNCHNFSRENTSIKPVLILVGRLFAPLLGLLIFLLLICTAPGRMPFIVEMK